MKRSSAFACSALLALVGAGCGLVPDAAPVVFPNTAPVSVPSYAASSPTVSGSPSAAPDAAVSPPARPRAKATTFAPKPARTQTAPQSPRAFEFVIASFNVLGDSHTAPGGDKAGRGLASGRVRAGWMAGLLDAHGVDVAGLQELQRPQLEEFQRVAGATYDVYPGSTLGNLGSENSIVWRRDSWELVHPGTVDIPYFNGQRRPMPIVLLRSRTTGLEAYFANFHNPATIRRFGDQQSWRTLATREQVTLVNSLVHESGRPVFVTGDMNEREEYFCAITGGTTMRSASGGSNDGFCRPPPQMGVDWIFGSADVAFTGYALVRSSLVQQTSDHPLVLARAQIR